MKHTKYFRAASAALIVTIAILLLASGASAASKYKTLHEFTGPDGAVPTARLVFDQAGNLYGTTNMGGTGAGTVFKLAPNADGSWTESVIYDVYEPLGPLIFDGAGNLYGTSSGGSVFELTPNLDGSWSPSVLYSFCQLTNCNDGSSPYGGLVFDKAGNLYGTTWGGGPNNLGTVFKLTHKPDGSWSERVLHHFKNGRDGAEPESTLILDKAGNLYGTTPSTVFELTPDTNGNWKEKILHEFTGGKDGGGPGFALIFDQEGNLYGGTVNGGDHRYCSGYGCGNVFELIPNADGTWKEKVLHQFTGGRDGGGAYGGGPYDGLTFDAAGNLYGTTYAGGIYGGGVAFRLTADSTGKWHEKVLHAFAAKKKANPMAGLIFDEAGNLYGTTSWFSRKNYQNGAGTVFEITP